MTVREEHLEANEAIDDNLCIENILILVLLSDRLIACNLSAF